MLLFLYDFTPLCFQPFLFKLSERSDIFYPQNSSLVPPCEFLQGLLFTHGSAHGSVLLETAPASAPLHPAGTGWSAPPKRFHFQLIPRHPSDRGASRFALLLLKLLIVIKSKLCCHKEVKWQVLSNAVASVTTGCVPCGIQFVGLSLLIRCLID